MYLITQNVQKTHNTHPKSPRIRPFECGPRTYLYTKNCIITVLLHMHLKQIILILTNTITVLLKITFKKICYILVILMLM